MFIAQNGKKILGIVTIQMKLLIFSHIYIKRGLVNTLVKCHRGHTRPWSCFTCSLHLMSIIPRHLTKNIALYMNLIFNLIDGLRMSLSIPDIGKWGILDHLTSTNLARSTWKWSWKANQCISVLTAHYQKLPNRSSDGLWPTSLGNYFIKYLLISRIWKRDGIPIRATEQLSDVQ